MHDLITKIDKGSVATAKTIISTAFKGDNQWYSKGPLSLLTSSINKRLNIVIKIGKVKTCRISGILLLYDRHFNLVLQDCTLNHHTHQSIFIRGSLVVFIST
jgi:small nuclear ribonucleoprotein (snRNP)-like protein